MLRLRERARYSYQFLKFWVRYSHWKLVSRRSKNAMLWRFAISGAQECYDERCIFNCEGCQNPEFYAVSSKWEEGREVINSCSLGLWRYENYHEKRMRKIIEETL